MDINKTNVELQNFWNDQFRGLEPMEIKKEDIDATDKLDQYFKYVGDNAERILDIGTGYGFSLVTACVLGEKVKYGLGIDTSVNAINFINKTCEKSNIKGIEYRVGGVEELEKIEDESFDGIICSNVLDVIPTQTANEIIKNMIRILKKDGIILLKFNFLLTEDLIKKINMEKVEDNAYAINGILRGVNLETSAWIEKFPFFKTVKIDTYDRIKKGPEDRIIVLQK